MGTPRKRLFRRTAATGLALATLAVAVAPAGAGPGNGLEQARRRGAFPVAVARDFRFNAVPDDLRPGTYDFTFVNVSREQFHEIVLFKVGDGVTVEDVVGAADANNESFFSDFRGVSFAGPLSVQRTEEIEPGFVAGRADLSERGQYAYLCFIEDPETGKPHYQLGMVGLLDVE